MTMRESLLEREAALDIRRIQRILPHRYPMLLVDRVLEIDGDTKATGIKNVTFNDIFFQGHYPGTPIMPGVLIVEAMAQLGGILLSQKLEHTGKLAVLLSMDKVKMRQPVVPGDQLVTGGGCRAGQEPHGPCAVQGIRSRQARCRSGHQIHARRRRARVGRYATDFVVKDFPFLGHRSERSASVRIMRSARSVFVGPHVTIGRGNKLLSHVVITGHTTVGDEKCFPSELRHRRHATGPKISRRSVRRRRSAIATSSAKRARSTSARITARRSTAAASRGWAMTTC